MIDPSLAAVLVCPVDKADLQQNRDAGHLVCTSCGRSYPVRGGIPIMLVDQPEGNPTK